MHTILRASFSINLAVYPAQCLCLFFTSSSGQNTIVLETKLQLLWTMIGRHKHGTIELLQIEYLVFEPVGENFVMSYNAVAGEDDVREP